MKVSGPENKPFFERRKSIFLIFFLRFFIQKVNRVRISFWARKKCFLIRFGKFLVRWLAGCRRARSKAALDRRPGRSRPPLDGNLARAAQEKNSIKTEFPGSKTKTSMKPSPMKNFMESFWKKNQKLFGKKN